MSVSGSTRKFVLSVVVLTLVVYTVAKYGKDILGWDSTGFSTGALNRPQEIQDGARSNNSFQGSNHRGSKVHASEEEEKLSPQCCVMRNGFQGKWVRRDPPLVIETRPALEKLTGCFGSQNFVAHHCYLREVFWSHDSQWSQKQDFQRAVRMLQWEWVQEGCDAEGASFNAESFVELLKNKTLLYVGDSLTQQTYDELRCRLEPYINPAVNLVPIQYEKSGKKTQKAGYQLNNSGRVYFIRNDDLVDPERYIIQRNKSQEGELSLMWASYALEADIIVFNTGAHYRPLYSLKRTAIEVMKFLAELPEDKERLFFYRTMSPGHVGCNATVEPYFFDLRGTPLNWFDFRLFDSVWEEQISALKKNKPHIGKRFHILDAYPITHPRGDAHSNPPIDCLHYCIPGPIHYCNVLLWASLKCSWQ